MKTFVFGLIFAVVLAQVAAEEVKKEDLTEGVHEELNRQGRQVFEGAETLTYPLYGEHTAPAPVYAAPAPVYAAPAPAYSAPAKQTYAPAKQVYAPAKLAKAPAPVVYSYQAPAPTVPCAKNLVVSCAPSVQPVPCAPAPAYAPAAGYAY